jgi:hypothetical protein
VLIKADETHAAIGGSSKELGGMVGKNIEKRAPDLLGAVEVLKRSVPPWPFTIPIDTHNPIPVPFCPFVE